MSPFVLIKRATKNKIIDLMKLNGIGCYNRKAQTFVDLANSGFNLKKCNPYDLETIKGIGKKTSRCFVIHSRPNQQYAGLDRHILTFLRERGYEDIPKNTPAGKRYDEIEKIFIKEAKNIGKPIADFDLELWNRYRSK